MQIKIRKAMNSDCQFFYDLRSDSLDKKSVFDKKKYTFEKKTFFNLYSF